MGIKGAVVRAFGKSAEVLSRQALSPHVIRLSLGGAALRGLTLGAGDKIKVHVGAGAVRSYTPSSFDAETGAIEVVVHAHGHSPGSDWVRGLAVGDVVRFAGPTKSVAGSAAGLPWAAFYGDETTIGLARFVASTLPQGAALLGGIETAAEDLAAVDGLPLEGVARGEVRGLSLLEHLERTSLPATGGCVWLSGEAGSVLALRKALLDRGLRREQMRIKPYWSVQGKAHRKRLERGILRS